MGKRKSKKAKSVDRCASTEEKPIQKKSIDGKAFKTGELEDLIYFTSELSKEFIFKQLCLQ